MECIMNVVPIRITLEIMLIINLNKYNKPTLKIRNKKMFCLKETLDGVIYAT